MKNRSLIYSIVLVGAMSLILLFIIENNDKLVQIANERSENRTSAKEYKERVKVYKEYYPNNPIADGADSDLEELIEIIYISNQKSIDRRNATDYARLISETEVQLKENIQKFENAKEQYHLLSDEMLDTLDEITYGDAGDQEGTVGYLLADLYDSLVKKDNIEELEVYTAYLEQYFRYFMLYWHYNKSGGEQIFLDRIEKTEKEIYELEKRIEGLKLDGEL